MLTVRFNEAGKTDCQFECSETATYIVGRHPGAEILVQDGRISSQHGEFSYREGHWRYRDLRSTNGSLLLSGNRRLVVDGLQTVDVALASGDTLLLGDVDDPVVVTLHIDAATVTAPVEGTVVSRSPMLGAEHAQNALGKIGAASIVNLLIKVGDGREVRSIFEPIGTWLLDTLRGSSQVVLVEKGEMVLVTENGVTKAVERDSEHVPYPRESVRESMETGEALLVVLGNDAAQERSLVRLDAVSAAVVPIVHSGELFGVLVVMATRLLQERELNVISALSSLVAHGFAHAQQMKRLRAVERRLREENRYLRESQPVLGTFSDIIGQAPSMRVLFEHMQVVMDTDATVLVTGETGTGKELIARALHDKSRRKDALFAAVNCAALAENLLESELFGHVKGAFTGATERKLGLFSVADRGTLFLDEVGEMSLRLQAKLLRVLQEGEVLPVGATRPIKVNVRIIAATHRDLRAMSREGAFREDLFYRINVFPLRLPPLRERREDILPLAEYFLARYAKKFGRSVEGLTQSAADLLMKHDYPGNIRELENEIQRAVLLTMTSSLIDVQVLSEEVRSGALTSKSELQTTDTGSQASLRATMEAYERSVLISALEQRGWNRSATARDLGISRQALLAKLSRYELRPD